ncbi:MAG: sulfatase [Myxococcota bacterium]
MSVSITALDKDEATTPENLRRAGGFLGWMLHALASGIALDVMVPATKLSARIAHHAVDLGRHIGAASLVLVLSLLWERFGPRSRWVKLGAIAVAAGVLGWQLLPGDLRGSARTLAGMTGLTASTCRVVLAIVVSQVLTVGWLLVDVLAARRHGWSVLLALAAGSFVANLVLVPSRSPSVHLFLGIATALLLGGVSTAYLDRRRVHVTNKLGTTRVATVGLAIGLLAALWPLALSTQLDLKRWSPSLFSRFGGLQRMVRPNPPELDAAELAAGYYGPRDDMPPIPPTPRKRPKHPPIVLFITIDAVRADLLETESAKELPALSRFARLGAHFTNARSASAATVVSLASISTGKYFSQLRWTEYEGDDWLPEEHTTHLAEYLVAGGVDTVVVPGAPWQSERFGMTRGFLKGTFDKRKKKGVFTRGRKLYKRVRVAIRDRDPERPLFLHCHFFDPHRPYNSGKLKKGAPFDRYVSEVSTVDVFIARIWKSVRKLRLQDRTFMIIASDHGEAFGEHGVKHIHAVNLYEELVRVPLIVVGPGVRPRRIDEPVTLVDLSSTIMDLFDLDTPGDFMGQTLVPHLLGEDPVLDRPIVIEGLEKQAMVFRNGIKVIRDNRAKSVEIYDLANDPRELANLSEDVDLKTNPEYARLFQFFETHTYRAPGYEHPRR